MKIEFNFQNLNRSRFLWPLQFGCLIVDFALLLTKDLNLTWKEIISQTAKK